MAVGDVRRRRAVRPISVVSLALTVVILLGVDVRAGGVPNGSRPHHVGGRYQNLAADYSYTLAERAQYLLTGKHLPKLRSGLTPVPNDGRALRAKDATAVTWIGHASFLVQIGGVNVLTDPHWGNTASPVSFAGPRRMTPPGVAFENLPPIHAVVISHDHWDHLDEATVVRLAKEHRPRFFVPLGLKAWLNAKGVDNVVEMDWWEEQSWKGLTFVCTPVQHSSGRWLHDQNERLWASWVVAGKDHRLLFLGDTGYHQSLVDIKRLGPFDMVLMPVGGYSAFHRRHPNHVNPEEAVQLFEEVGGKLMVPMHWGTFDMNREPIDEPPRRALAEAVKRGLEDQIAILSPGQTLRW